MASGKFKNTVALITGGDSGIGRAVSLAFAKEGAELLIDYSSAKGAIVSFTRSLALSLVSKGIRVNGVNLDPSAAFKLSRRVYYNFWFKYSYEKSWPACRTRTYLCLPSLR
jgi:NAD(P)-dependent dehydrogenase (short-subunit alcohol dehydrogenase family)